MSEVSEGWQSPGMAGRDVAPFVPRGQTVQTLDRGLRVLALLAQADGGLTVTEIAEAIKIHRAAAYRLITTLEAHRYVARGSDGRYALWIALLELSRGVLPQLRTVASPILEGLADDLGATAHLTILDGDEAVTLVVREPKRADIHLAYRPGLRHSVRVGASGKAILAGRPPEPGEPEEITTARQTGCAHSSGELQAGAVGVAAPIIVGGMPAEASVGVVGIGELLEGAPARVIEAARALGRALG